jgi:hypothetical protein
MAVDIPTTDQTLAPAPSSSKLQQGLSTAVDPFESLKTKYPATPLPKMVSVPVPKAENLMKREETALAPYRTEVERLSKEEAQFEGAKAGAEQEAKVLSTEQKLEAQRRYEQRLQEIYDSPERKEIEKSMAKPFVPTQENAQDLTRLFTLVTIVGFALGGAGKSNAQAALSAMNGMVEGHNKGREDIYKKEKEAFDTNLKQLKTRWDALMKDLEQAEKVAASNLTTGTLMAEEAAAKHLSTFTKMNLDKFGLKPTLENARAYYQAMNKAYDTSITFEQQARAKNAELENQFKLKAYEQAEQSRREFIKAEIDRLKKASDLGSGAFLRSTIGISSPTEKINDKIVDTAEGISQLNRVINIIRDPEVRTGVPAKLSAINEKIASLYKGSPDHEITDDELKQIINGEISSEAKNAIALKEALFGAYTAEREIAGGRLLVAVVRQAGGALDPTNYEKTGYLNLIGNRREELVKRLRAANLNDDQINRIVDGLNERSAQYPPFGGQSSGTKSNVGITSTPTEEPANIPADARKAPDGHYYVPDPNRPGKYLRVD